MKFIRFRRPARRRLVFAIILLTCLSLSSCCQGLHLRGCSYVVRIVPIAPLFHFLTRIRQESIIWSTAKAWQDLAVALLIPIKSSSLHVQQRDNTCLRNFVWVLLEVLITVACNAPQEEWEVVVHMSGPDLKKQGRRVLGLDASCVFRRKIGLGTQETFAQNAGLNVNGGDCSIRSIAETA